MKSTFGQSFIAFVTWIERKTKQKRLNNRTMIVSITISTTWLVTALSTSMSKFSWQTMFQSYTMKNQVIRIGLLSSQLLTRVVLNQEKMEQYRQEATGTINLRLGSLHTNPQHSRRFASKALSVCLEPHLARTNTILSRRTLDKVPTRSRTTLGHSTWQFLMTKAVHRRRSKVPRWKNSSWLSVQ